MTTYLLAVTVDDDGADSAEHLAEHIEHVVGFNSAVYSDKDIRVLPAVHIVETLRYYGDRENYEPHGFGDGIPVVIEHKGGRARAALANLGLT